LGLIIKVDGDGYSPIKVSFPLRISFLHSLIEVQNCSQGLPEI
jgi:hypothetical protein